MTEEVPTAGPLNASPNRSIVARLNDKIEPWRNAPTWVNHVDGRSLRLPRLAYLGFAGAFLVLSLLSLVVWSRFGGWGPGRTSIACAVTGTVFLLGKRALRQVEYPAVKSSDSSSSDVSVHWFGYDTNLLLLQLFALGTTIVRGFRLELSEAWWAAVIAAGLMPLLYRTSKWRLSLAIGAVAIVYLAYSWITYDLSYAISANAYSRIWSGFGLPIGAILNWLMVLAIVPQSQLIALNGVGIGRFKGDTSVKLFGSTVLVALTSTIVLMSAAVALEALFYAPSWISAAFQV